MRVSLSETAKEAAAQSATPPPVRPRCRIVGWISMMSGQVGGGWEGVQVQDVVRATLSFDFFEQSRAKMRAAAGERIVQGADVAKVVEVTGKAFAITHGECK